MPLLAMPKMNPEILRALLFKVENLQDGSTHSFYVDELVREGGVFADADLMEIRLNMIFLFEKKYVVGQQLALTRFEVERLTVEGAEFLESVRDERIWKATKDGATAARGFTLELLKALGKGLLKKRIQELTGVELDL